MRSARERISIMTSQSELLVTHFHFFLNHIHTCILIQLPKIPFEYNYAVPL